MPDSPTCYTGVLPEYLETCVQTLNGSCDTGFTNLWSWRPGGSCDPRPLKTCQCCLVKVLDPDRRREILIYERLTGLIRQWNLNAYERNPFLKFSIKTIRKLSYTLLSQKGNSSRAKIRLEQIDNKTVQR